MDPRLFHFPLVTVGTDGRADRILGNSFPITDQGDLLTCRHVVDVKQGVDVYVLDPATGFATPVRADQIAYPASDSLDLACLRNMLPPGNHFYPLLSPGSLKVGHNVSTYGVYGERWRSSPDGIFKGYVVSFRTESGAGVMALSYPVIEGLSGSPVTLFHNGTKAVGLCTGSDQQRVQASEVLDFSDGEREVRETIHRIVEQGRAYRVEELIAFCKEIGVTPTVTDERFDDPELNT